MRIVPFLVVILLAAAAGARGERMSMRNVDARIDALESIIDGFYRGETIDETRTKLNALVDEHNALIEARNADIKEAEKKLDWEMRPLNALEKQIEEMDRQLERKPSRTDAAGVRAYNSLLENRNALVGRFNELNKNTKVKIDAYNAGARGAKSELGALRRSLEAKRADLHARVDAYEKFQKAEQDVKFYTNVNRLYGQLHEERRRTGGGRAVGRAIARLMGIRAELGAYAIARHQRSDHGLVVVEVAVGGAGGARGGSSASDVGPCYLIVDTGAMRTTLAPGMVVALGLSGELGEEVELSLAGGMKTKGRECVLPSVAVAGRTERDVPAAAVKVSEVGIDGLLGQTFLKRFVYTIDETKREKLILKPRRRR